MPQPAQPGTPAEPSSGAGLILEQTLRAAKHRCYEARVTRTHPVMLGLLLDDDPPAGVGGPAFGPRLRIEARNPAASGPTAGMRWRAVQDGGPGGGAPMQSLPAKGTRQRMALWHSCFSAQSPTAASVPLATTLPSQPTHVPGAEIRNCSVTLVPCTTAADSFCARARRGTWPGGSRDNALQGRKPKPTRGQSACAAARQQALQAQGAAGLASSACIRPCVRSPALERF